ncbi:MAG: response regulator [Candidatus Omnitrophica bacterium]|nr:response regulator [Candidatus Omnitrophota bacterium]
MEKNIKVLLVDDETDISQPMAFWFGSKGYYVIVATNGEDAIKLVEEKKPDIIFLDLNMPGMDGIQTLKKLREFDKEVPVIIVSAYVDQDKIKQVEPHGISGVFYKGDDLEKGLFVLETTLRRHKRLK